MSSGLEHIHLPYLSWEFKSEKINSKVDFLAKINDHCVHFKRATDGLKFLANNFFNENGRQAVFCIPEYICKEVTDALKCSNAKIVYFKIDQNLAIQKEDLQKKLNENMCDFVLVVNYFGQPADLNVVKKIIGNGKTLIIEDNTHGFLGREKNGEWLGLRADLGLFSPRKTLPIPFGGMLFSSKKIFWQTEKYSLLKLSLKSKFSFFIKLFLKYLMSAFLLKKYASFLRKNNLVATEVDNSPIEIFNWIEWTKIWNFDREIERRRQVHFNILKMAKEQNILPLNNLLGPFESPYGLAFLNKNIEEVKKIKEIFIKQDMEIFLSPELPEEIEVPTDHHYKNIYVLRYLW